MKKHIDILNVDISFLKWLLEKLRKENYLLDDSNIMAFIRKIRKKIEATPDAPEYIITIWGIGYKFNDNI